MRTITGVLELINGTPAAGKQITFTLVNSTNNKPISSFIAATHERVYGSVIVTTDEFGAFSVSLVENTLLVDETYYLVTTNVSPDIPFRAGLAEGLTDLDWLEFKASGGQIEPAVLDIIQNYIDEAEANQKTADSYATEAEDTFVKVYTSNGDGTFTATDTTEYSALHYAAKGSDFATTSQEGAQVIL
ncbi:MAG: hypothetical protein M0Q19_05090, partial [Candidatus Cloacimonetes bacterium]|nr:hypothetical protein [Candidatus Cloacimonadota bacterium]